MSEIPGIDTPINVFTQEEVLSLNDFQFSNCMHPFTCGSGHRTEHADGEGILIATVRGWVCPFCEYTQDWAHAWMKNGEWRKLGGYQIQDMLRERMRLREEHFDELAFDLDAAGSYIEHLRNALQNFYPNRPLPASEMLAKIRRLLDALKAKGIMPVEKTQEPGASNHDDKQKTD